MELGIDTAAFKSGLDKSTYQAKAFASQLKSEFSNLGESISNLAGSFASFGPASGIIAALSDSFKVLGTSISGAGSGAAPLLAALGFGAVALGAAAAGAAAAFFCWRA